MEIKELKNTVTKIKTHWIGSVTEKRQTWGEKERDP